MLCLFAGLLGYYGPNLDPQAQIYQPLQVDWDAGYVAPEAAAMGLRQVMS